MVTIPLGRLPLPRTSDGLSLRLRQGIAEAVAPVLSNPTAMRILVRPDAPDIDLIDVDASGTAITSPLGPPGAHEPERQPQEEPGGAPVPAPGRLRHLQVRARPMEVLGAPVHLDARLRDLAIAWREEDGSGRLILAEPSAQSPLHGQVEIRISQAGLATAIERLGTHLLEGRGALDDVELEISGAAPGTLRISGSGRIRRGPLRARVRVGAQVDVQEADPHQPGAGSGPGSGPIGSGGAPTGGRPALVATLAQVRVASRHPVVAAMLAVAAKDLQGLQGRRVPLRSPEGEVGVTALRVTTGPDLSVSAVLGGGPA